MKEARELADEYARAMETTKRVEEELAGVLIKYLVTNSFEPKKCTETAISDSLGIPKSMIRRVLSRLSDEFLVRTEDWGTVKPYEVFCFGSALDKGYLSLEKEELAQMLAIREEEGTQLGLTKGEPSVWMERDGKRIVRFLGPGQRRVYQTLIDRFFWYLPSTGFEKAFNQAFPPEVLDRLGELAPEQALLDDVSRLPRSSEPLWYAMYIPMDQGSLNKASPEGVKKASQASIYARFAFVLSRLRALESLIVEKGCYAEAEKELSRKKGCPIDRVMNSKGELQGEEAFRKEYLFATTLALRQGAKFATRVGAIDGAEVREAEQLCTSLEQAICKPNQPIEPTLGSTRKREKGGKSQAPR